MGVGQQLSDLGLELGHEKRHRPRRSFGCLAVLLALAVLVGGGYLAYSYGMTAIKDRLSGPEDYSGSGTGQVLVEVKDGDAATDIGQTLREKDVVKSVQAFNDAAREDPESVGHPGRLLPAEEADVRGVGAGGPRRPGQPDALGGDRPRGLHRRPDRRDARQEHRLLEEAVREGAGEPADIGLPAYAEGNAEGYLFPATYELPPNATPKSILTLMVKRWSQAAEEADLEGAAQKLGYTPAELMTVASLVEAESNRDADRGKVARVIYNRLETDATDNLLQIDATVNYGIGRNLGVGLTTEDLAVDSPYNTYKNAGLPPTPDRGTR